MERPNANPRLSTDCQAELTAYASFGPTICRWLRWYRTAAFVVFAASGAVWINTSSLDAPHSSGGFAVTAASPAGRTSKPAERKTRPPSVEVVSQDRQVDQRGRTAISVPARVREEAVVARPRSGRVASSGVLRPADVARVAVKFALSQVGKPYRWGAEGPAAFDCSGLTQQAYLHAGEAIPRTSREQARFGTQVAIDELLPGDLLFYAYDVHDLETVHHVTMYLGDGMVVHAPQSRDVVRVARMWLSKLAIAVRPAAAQAAEPSKTDRRQAKRSLNATLPGLTAVSSMTSDSRAGVSRQTTKPSLPAVLRPAVVGPSVVPRSPVVSGPVVVSPSAAPTPTVTPSPSGAPTPTATPSPSVAASNSQDAPVSSLPSPPSPSDGV
ncbi:NlpC/P60 family protein [Streptomyces sp. SID13031]|uniref:C40 family peptidase n=1 Tax=Streptomyces sp. SID13031 TaxID=2706046 RepID=UPI0013CB1929|nr:NlpC/P60 family protein [Streptomyces sp. SID13031]NEA37359.1 C40 family peptidase [Streptomyces sp. SID13031]